MGLIWKTGEVQSAEPIMMTSLIHQYPITLTLIISLYTKRSSFGGGYVNHSYALPLNVGPPTPMWWAPPLPSLPPSSFIHSLTDTHKHIKTLKHRLLSPHSPLFLSLPHPHNTTCISCGPHTTLWWAPPPRTAHFLLK